LIEVYMLSASVERTLQSFYPIRKVPRLLIKANISLLRLVILEELLPWF